MHTYTYVYVCVSPPMFMMSTGGKAIDVSRLAQSIVKGTYGAHASIHEIAALPQDRNFERALVNWCKWQSFMRPGCNLFNLAISSVVFQNSLHEQETKPKRNTSNRYRNSRTETNT
jgi:hypothetical protein